MTKGFLGSTNLDEEQGSKAWDAFVAVAFSLLLKDKAVYIPGIGEFRIEDSEHKEVHGEMPYRVATRREAVFNPLKGVMVRFLQECERAYSANRNERDNDRRPTFLEVERRKKKPQAGDRLSTWKYRNVGPRMDRHDSHNCPLPIETTASSEG